MQEQRYYLVVWQEGGGWASLNGNYPTYFEALKAMHDHMEEDQMLLRDHIEIRDATPWVPEAKR